MQILSVRPSWIFLNPLLLWESPNSTLTSSSISSGIIKEVLESKSCFLKNVRSTSTIQNLEMLRKNNLLNWKISLINLQDQSQSKWRKTNQMMTKLRLLEKRSINPSTDWKFKKRKKKIKMIKLKKKWLKRNQKKKLLKSKKRSSRESKRIRKRIENKIKINQNPSKKMFKTTVNNERTRIKRIKELLQSRKSISVSRKESKERVKRSD